MNKKTTIADRFYKIEADTLSPNAFHCADTKGRKISIEASSVRTEFQRDRDRIIHSKAFRRLMHKTQVFLFPSDEHYMNRMTHTLEVAQIARVIARALGLNEDLTEASALGHDLGHSPFGHAGEIVMQNCFSKDYTHAKQSLRVVDFLENDGEGLNLTWEVRDAIVNHTGKDKASTLEGRLIKVADRIAYINHDIDDSERAGILTEDQIPKDVIKVLGTNHSERINTMVTGVIDESLKSDDIVMTSEVEQATDELRKFMFENVYINPVAKGEEHKAKKLLEMLFDYYVDNPYEMPDFFYKNTLTSSVKRSVCDYISGMTDRYAIEKFKEIFIPSVWDTSILNNGKEIDT